MQINRLTLSNLQWKSMKISVKTFGRIAFALGTMLGVALSLFALSFIQIYTFNSDQKYCEPKGITLTKFDTYWDGKMAVCTNADSKTFWLVKVSK